MLARSPETRGISTALPISRRQELELLNRRIVATSEHLQNLRVQRMAVLAQIEDDDEALAMATDQLWREDGYTIDLSETQTPPRQLQDQYDIVDQ